METMLINRRKFIKIASATAVLPLAAMGSSHAAQNAAMRSALKYRETPLDGKKCLDCMHFVPGADAKALGGCRMLAGDTEVSPNAYCAAFAKKA